MVNFGVFLKTLSLKSNSVTRQVSFKRTKIGGKCQNKFIFSNYRDEDETFLVILNTVLLSQ